MLLRMKKTKTSRPGVEETPADLSQVPESTAGLHELVSIRAYEIYLERGYASDPLADWLQAESEVRVAMRALAPLEPATAKKPSRSRASTLSKSSASKKSTRKSASEDKAA